MSNILRDSIKQEILAMEGARRSSEIAAERRSKARLWLVGPHTRLTALATARWAAENARTEPGSAEFIELIAAEEKRLREMFENRAIPLKQITERVVALRDTRNAPTTIVTDSRIDEVCLHEQAEAVVEWLVEAVCPFIPGHLFVNLKVTANEVTVTLEANELPAEVMHPFTMRDIGGRQCIEGKLALE
jgi:hypothetical protein